MAQDVPFEKPFESPADAAADVLGDQFVPEGSTVGDVSHGVFSGMSNLVDTVLTQSYSNLPESWHHIPGIDGLFSGTINASHHIMNGMSSIADVGLGGLNDISVASILTMLVTFGGTMLFIIDPPVR